MQKMSAADFDPYTRDIVGTFVYHDGPRLYTIRTAAGDLMLVNCVDGDEEQDTYLFTALPDHLCAALDEQPLRDVMLAGAEISAWCFRWAFRGRSATAQPIEASDIPESWLPDAEVKLRD